MKMLYLMCGISFSGKSTLARQIGKRIDAKIVSLDEINNRRGLGLNGEEIPDEEWVKTHEIAQSEVKYLMGNSQNIILDDTNCFRWLRDRYRMLAESHGYDTTLIYVNTDENVAKSRLIQNRILKKRSGIPLEYFLAHVKTFERPSPDEECLVFYGNDDPEKWVGAHF